MKNENIEKLLNKMVHENVFPGAVYSLLTDDNIYMGAVGNKSLIPNIEKNSIDTLYDMASLTKVIVTNTIITRMLYKNKIKLDDKVSYYLKEFKHKEIIILDLLTHTSGLPADSSLKEIKNKDDLISKIYHMDLEYEPGRKVIYSDIGFILLGLIIEKVYQKSLDEVAKEEVFIPLGMNDSCYNPEDKERCAPTELTESRSLVKGFVHDEKADTLEGVAGHAGLFSTISDVTKFCKMIQDNGGDYLPKEYIDLWFKPLKPINDKEFRSIGWVVGKDENITGNLGSMDTISHTGFTGTSIVINRKSNICCVLLSNRVHPTRENKRLIISRKIFSNVCFEEVQKKIKKLIK